MYPGIELHPAAACGILWPSLAFFSLDFACREEPDCSFL
ncbi:hypothetical protein A343_1384 [Porphyromonas gingivalis JCVI SC001]|nr:hypothetical protein A343_1384 [Porphyromonas gingivalis JCVI SC001]